MRCSSGTVKPHAGGLGNPDAQYHAFVVRIPKKIQCSSICDHDFEQLDYKLEYGKKLFVQVNHSQAIEDILDVLLIN